MNNLRVTMIRTPDLSEDEVSRRLSRCYELILQCARKNRAADVTEADRPDTSAAENPPVPGPKAQREYST